MSEDLKKDPNIELELTVRYGSPPTILIDEQELKTDYKKWRILKKDFQNAVS